MQLTPEYLRGELDRLSAQRLQLDGAIQAIEQLIRIAEQDDEAISEEELEGMIGAKVDASEIDNGTS